MIERFAHFRVPINPMTNRVSFIAAGLLISAISARAQRITRGPYLQSLTPTNVIVRWRTDRPTANEIRYACDPKAVDKLAGSEDRKIPRCYQWSH